MTLRDFAFACPACRAPLERRGSSALRCIQEGTSYRREDGIWRLLTSESARRFGDFLEQYTEIRRREGRGSTDPSHYRELPFRDTTGRFQREWRIRGRSFQALETRVVEPLAARGGRALEVLDLGAGSGWLSYHLARKGHEVAAVDVSVDPTDGLGAHRHFGSSSSSAPNGVGPVGGAGAPFVPVEADFDRLPFQSGTVDLIIYNASLHYSTDYHATLAEGLRVLRPQGTLVVMDTPLYRDPESGRRMIRERETGFSERYGFPSNALPSEGFLTYARLEELAEALRISWSETRPFYGVRWALRPWLQRLRRGREPAAFALLAARRVGGSGKTASATARRTSASRTGAER